MGRKGHDRVLSQDHATDFDADLTVFDWMKQWGQAGDDDRVIRGVLGKLLFSGDDAKKSVKSSLGREKGTDAVRQADPAAPECPDHG